MTKNHLQTSVTKHQWKTQTPAQQLVKCITEHATNTDKLIHIVTATTETETQAITMEFCSALGNIDAL